MNKLLWIASSLIAMSALLSGCKIGTPCDTSADCDSESFCDVDFYCSDNRDYAGCFDTSDCPLSDQQCLDVTTTAGTNGTLCSMFCSSSAQCRPNLGFPGACYSPTSAGDFICFQNCADDIDCELNSRCIQVDRTDGFVDFACIPGA